MLLKVFYFMEKPRAAKFSEAYKKKKKKKKNSNQFFYFVKIFLLHGQTKGS